MNQGSPYPLGPSWTEGGLNLAFFSAEAEGAELCIYADERSAAEEWRGEIAWRTGGVFHCEIKGVKPGQGYGLRVYGAYEPGRGLRFNHHKLLLEPYARAVARVDGVDDALFAYRRFHPDGDLAIDNRDSGAVAPLGVLIEDRFEWQGDRPPQTPWGETVLYEAQVSGLTRLHPDLPEELRGTYAALGHPAIIDHLQKLGVTAVELLPVHQRHNEPFLALRKLSNYWGYTTLGFFAPDRRFARAGSSAQQCVDEFKTMVRALHHAGIEVILDVVYNHSCESDHLGPTLSLRGIDNRSYYHLRREAPRFYEDFTGCGNALNLASPAALQLTMDSLRYWVQEMHVDGFRFDLAVTLLRGDNNGPSPFLATIGQDPALSKVKLIAEPWDLGPDGHRTGRFPANWSEWNDAYRDGVRRFWRKQRHSLGGFVTRLAGSSDIFRAARRTPRASLNFITAHDGFTMIDLVSYEKKHNDANGEDNRDGTDHNLSWNCGVEGASEDAGVLDRRQRTVRSLLATLALSRGIPMINSGDELGRSQQGNNNVYCQDNALAWLDWRKSEQKEDLFQSAARFFALRKRLAMFASDRFLEGAGANGGQPDVHWLSLHGTPLSEREWRMPHLFAFAAWFAGEEGGPDALLLFNAARRNAPFRLPAGDWQAAADSSGAAARPSGEQPAGGFYRLPGYSVAVLLQGQRAAEILREVDGAGR